MTIPANVIEFPSEGTYYWAEGAMVTSTAKNNVESHDEQELEEDGEEGVLFGVQRRYGKPQGRFNLNGNH